MTDCGSVVKYYMVGGDRDRGCAKKGKKSWILWQKGTNTKGKRKGCAIFSVFYIVFTHGTTTNGIVLQVSLDPLKRRRDMGGIELMTPTTTATTTTNTTAAAPTTTHTTTNLRIGVEN